MPDPALDEEAVFAMLWVAERKIQAIMLELAEALEGSGWQIDHISADTRTYGNMKPEILVSRADA